MLEGKFMILMFVVFFEEYGFLLDDFLVVQVDGCFMLLMCVVKLGWLDIVEELLVFGVDIVVFNVDGCNVLWLVCYNGDYVFIECLIVVGIVIDNQNGNGVICLMYVLLNSKFDLV